MPELPDITAYLEALEARLVGARLARIEVLNPFLLRSAAPPLAALEGHLVVELRRLGKRIALRTDNGRWLVVHLMIAGRLHWHPATAKKPLARPTRSTLARWHFDTGVLSLTEAGTKRRASLHLLADEAALRDLDPGGLEVMDCSVADFRERLTLRNHTLKRALTDPRLFSGIGNAYSDEILHAARLSPIQQTQKLDQQQIATLFEATTAVLGTWIERLRTACGAGFPAKVTAFRDGMAVHGRYGHPCPDCGTTVQRIRYATNELNYCPRCQTGGRLLADRALSRLLHKDWPRTIEALEEGHAASDGLSS